jgi:hypothetical protein
LRTLPIIPIAIALAAGLGYALCGAFGWNAYPREMFFAAITTAVAAMLACVPVILSRSSAQIAVVQAALFGTILHLLASFGIATVIVFARLATAQPFLFWLVWLYWVVLFVLVVAFVKAVRSAPVGQVSSQ